MDYLENDNTEKKPLLKRVFSKQMLLFVLAYIVYFAVSRLQVYAGDFILQESGDLDSVTSYDYILPVISSATMFITLAGFLLLGFFAYGRDKIKMLRFPMAFSISAVIGAFLSSLFTALYSSPIIDFTNLNFNIIKVQSYIVVVLRVIFALVFFIYFDGEKDSDYYYGDYYAEYFSQRKRLRDKILSHRFSVLWTALIVVEGSLLFGYLVRAGFIWMLSLLPDEHLWLSYYIEVVFDVATYGFRILFAVYFAKDKRTTVKLLGLICLVSQAMKTFSFVFNSITNAFSQAGDHLLNSIFSTIFVNIATFLLSAAELILIVLVCYKLKKAREYEE